MVKMSLRLNFIETSFVYYCEKHGFRGRNSSGKIICRNRGQRRNTCKIFQAFVEVIYLFFLYTFPHIVKLFEWTHFTFIQFTHPRISDFFKRLMAKILVSDGKIILLIIEVGIILFPSFLLLNNTHCFCPEEKFFLISRKGVSKWVLTFFSSILYIWRNLRKMGFSVRQ